MAPAQYRAEFDADVTFSNGGGLRVEGFRVDVSGPDATPDEVANLFITSLNLLMVERVELRNLRVFPEQHKGTHGGPSSSSRTAYESVARHVLVELSHPISAGMITYPGLPGPDITAHLTRDDSRGVYADGVQFEIGRISMVGNTGTYLDSPYHRYADGADLAAIPLEALVDLPVALVRTVGSGSRAVDVGALAAAEVAGCAVLLHTGGDQAWGTPDYLTDAPYLTEAGARRLAEQGALLVGIDAINIDDTSDPRRPAHSTLLAAGIQIVEHLTGLEHLPPTGARFTAVPPRISAFGTFPVRAFASIPAPDSVRVAGA